MNSINPARIQSSGGTASTRDSQPGKSETGNSKAPVASKTEKPAASAGRFSQWTRGWIPGGWDGPF